MDAATGLIYVGNGQYYDPATGRFLTRDARPNQNNPYIPIDPAGALLGPLALLALAYGRKKSRGKWDTLVVLLVLSVSLGVGLAACKVEITTTPNPENPTEPIVIVTVTNEDGETQNFQLTKTPEAPTGTPSPECTDTPTPTPTLTDNEYRIQLNIDFVTIDEFKKIVREEKESLTLARVALAEATQGNNLELEYIMWTIKIRAAIGFPNYTAGSYKNDPLAPVSIKSVILDEGQYSPITEAFKSPLLAVAGHCNSNLRRAFNPCDEDLLALRNAHLQAQIIISQNVMDAPHDIRGYESFAAPPGRPNPPPKWCLYGDTTTEITRPAAYLAGGNTAFQDCALADNYWLWSGQ